MIRPPCAPTLAGRAVDLNELTDKIKELYNKFSRLVALLFDLQEPFERFGIELRRHAAGENPLRYWIVYVLALTASLYVGVYASGIAYD